MVAVVLLAGCSSDAGSSSGATADPTCPTPKWDAREVGRVALEPIDPGGPMVDRVLRATRAPDGDLCLQIAIDHADPGATTESYRIVARRGDRDWRQEGTDPDGEAPLRVERGGCVRVVGMETVRGQGDRSYRARARLRIGCGAGSA